MPDLFGRIRNLFASYEPSGQAARKRLQLVLVQDRIGLPQSELEAMKRDLVDVVSRYLVIDEETAEMEVRHFEDSMVLVSSIGVKDIARTPVAS